MNWIVLVWVRCIIRPKGVRVILPLERWVAGLKETDDFGTRLPLRRKAKKQMRHAEKKTRSGRQVPLRREAKLSSI